MQNAIEGERMREQQQQPRETRGGTRGVPHSSAEKCGWMRIQRRESAAGVWPILQRGELFDGTCQKVVLKILRLFERS